MSTLQSRIRELRGSSTQADFAKEFDIPINTLGRYERGVNNPDLDFLVKLNTKFGVSLDWLMFGVEKEPTSGSNEKQLYAKLVKSYEDLQESMRENAALKEENFKLKHELESLKNVQAADNNGESLASAS